MKKVANLILLITCIIVIGGCQKQNAETPPFETIVIFSPSFYYVLWDRQVQVFDSFYEWQYPSAQDNFWNRQNFENIIEEKLFVENILLFVWWQDHIELDFRRVNVGPTDWDENRFLIEVVTYYDFYDPNPLCSGEMKTFGFLVRVCRNFWGEVTGPHTVQVGHGSNL